MGGWHESGECARAWRHRWSSSVGWRLMTACSGEVVILPRGTLRSDDGYYLRNGSDEARRGHAQARPGQAIGDQ
jgi:hypothetical protein